MTKESTIHQPSGITVHVGTTVQYIPGTGVVHAALVTSIREGEIDGHGDAMELRVFDGGIGRTICGVYPMGSTWPGQTVGWQPVPATTAPVVAEFPLRDFVDQLKPIAEAAAVSALGGQLEVAVEREVKKQLDFIRSTPA